LKNLTEGDHSEDMDTTLELRNMNYSGDLLCDGNELKEGEFVHKLNEELLYHVLQFDAVLNIIL
jgi:hypothetical protein